MTDTKALATQHTHINIAQSKTHIHICIHIQKKTPATQHKLQKPKFTQYKPQQKKSEKAQYQSYKHNTAVEGKQILKLSITSSNSVFSYHFQTQSHHIVHLKPIYLTVHLT